MQAPCHAARSVSRRTEKESIQRRKETNETARSDEGAQCGLGRTTGRKGKTRHPVQHGVTYNRLWWRGVGGTKA